MSQTTAAPLPPAPASINPASGAPPRRLTRVADGKMLAGVCTGLARYAGVDPVVVRIGFAAATVLSGAGLLLYVACWVLMPKE